MSQEYNDTQGINEQDQAVAQTGRRNFLKLGIAGLAGVAGGTVGLGSSPNDAQAFIKQHDSFPVPLKKENFDYFTQARTILTNALLDPNLRDRFKKYLANLPRNEPGYTQLERALNAGGKAPTQYMAPMHMPAIPDSGAFSWDLADDHLAKEKYQFETKKEAAQVIKRAAELYKASLVGITPFDPRWNYSEFTVPGKKPFGWEKFPFKPKTVVVLAFEMDYHAMAAAPTAIASATAMVAYSEMVFTAISLATFFRGLGYRAIGAGNDLAINGGYAIAAGIGEAGRNGCIIAPKFGPRIRLAKVFTEFDFVEYDKPITFGVASFCENCKKCADSCPSKAITFEDKPTFEPTYSTNPNDTWSNQKGIYKYYNDSKKCFQFWLDNGTACGNCITSCPYNKPNFWHHHLTDYMNTMVPGPMHAFMREMDTWFGYGRTFDQAAIRRFWSKE